MTPKEKATEIFRKYYDILPFSNRMTSQSKKCAVILVYEIIANSNFTKESLLKIFFDMTKLAIVLFVLMFCLLLVFRHLW